MSVRVVVRGKVGCRFRLKYCLCHRQCLNKTNNFSLHLLIHLFNLNLNCRFKFKFKFNHPNLRLQPLQLLSTHCPQLLPSIFLSPTLHHKSQVKMSIRPLLQENRTADFLTSQSTNAVAVTITILYGMEYVQQYPLFATGIIF